jgi:hypothetical protein
MLPFAVLPSDGPSRKSRKGRAQVEILPRGLCATYVQTYESDLYPIVLLPRHEPARTRPADRACGKC